MFVRDQGAGRILEGELAELVVVEVQNVERRQARDVLGNLQTPQQPVSFHLPKTIRWREDVGLRQDLE